MKLLSYFSPKAPLRLAYLLQQVEYSPYKFMGWLKVVPDLNNVRQRGRLEMTNRVKLMLAIAYLGWVIPLVGGLVFGLRSPWHWWLLVCLLAPIISVVMLFVTTVLLQKLVVNPAQNREIAAAKKKLAGMKATRIAVLGSYGKTTMKDLLQTVLSQAKKVAATPGNKNVLISHARWVNSLSGDEKVLIFEYGESEPGDIVRLANFSKPDMAVVTGLAPAHLDGYSSLTAIAEDLASIQQFTDATHTYVNGQAEQLKKLLPAIYYTNEGIDTWKASSITIDFDGTNFSLKTPAGMLHLHSGLLGAHQIGPVCAVVAVAKELGLTDQQITHGIAATVPFEHRMQPRPLHGAWIIDDTYNGNIEGMRAGLALLNVLPGKRKIYVTPGLVDQGIETERVHHELGRLIAEVAPDKVVLMQNSVLPHIQTGLTEANFKGDLSIEKNPLEYYTNLEQYLAGGDVVMLQNDWPDAYK